MPQVELRVEHVERRDGDEVWVEHGADASTPADDGQHQRPDRSRDGTRCENAPCGKPQPNSGNRRRQCLGKLGRGHKPVRRRLRQRFGHGPIDGRRDRVPKAPHRRHRVGQPLGDHDLRARAGVGRLPREHLVQHAPETVDVAPLVHAGTRRALLGAHVARRPHCDPRPSQLLPSRRRDRSRDSEIRHYRMPRLEQDVLRLDVAMHDIMAVGVAQGIRNLARDLHCLGERELACSVEPIPQRLSFDVGHHVIQQTGSLARIVERQDVRVCEAGRDFDLLEKPFRAECRGQLGLQDLDGDFAMMLEVLGEVDRGHPATPQLALEGVALGEGCAERLDLAGHRRGSALSRCRAARASRT